MNSYLALLRGINVGGNSLIKMADLKDSLAKAGFKDARTYIQSGNVLFVSSETDTGKLAKQIENVIETTFKLDVAVVVFSKQEWQAIIKAAPAWWGKDADWKHNILVMVPPYDMKDVVTAYGQLKPDIETMAPGKGVMYQSLSWESFGKTTGGKLASNPIYKKMTIRNYNTATKLLRLFD